MQLEGALAGDRDLHGADEAIVVDALGRPDAFGELYLRHHRAVFRYLRSMGLSDDDAADLTSQTFERAYSRLEQFDRRRGVFVAWLIGIARNAALDTSRRRPIAAALPRFPVRSDDHDPEQQYLRAEAREHLLRCVSGLKPIQREALALRYAANLTAREIGQVLGKSEEATQKLLTRALAALKEAHDGI